MNHQPKPNLQAINVNLSTSGSRLGGAAIAAQFHSEHMAQQFPIELWRMWDQPSEVQSGALKIRNFASQTKLPRLERRMPRRLRSTLLDSQILPELLRQQPSIVHLHNPIPSLAFAKIARRASRAGIKVTASTHGFFEVMYPNYNLKPHETWLWRKTVTQPVVDSFQYMDAIFTLYPGESQMLIDRGFPAEKIHLIANGVNPFFLEPPTREEREAVIQKFKLNLAHPILLFIGNHTVNKGLHTVMRLASELTHPATIIIGGKLLSPEEPAQWQQKQPTHPNVKVVFTDYLSLAEQRALYRLSNLLLFPSIADTLPLTIIEAMAMELPVVAYDVGGIAYQLSEDAGVVVEKSNFSAYRQAVEALLDAPDRRQAMAQTAQRRQQSIFSWDIAARKTIAVYQELLAQPTMLLR